MSYLDELGLARYDGLLKSWAVREACTDQFLNWQKTGPAGAVSFSPVPEMPLDPVVNFLFTETGPASGTKGPGNPSTITGKTQLRLWRAGKNLIYPKTAATTINGVTFTPNANGSITVTGVPTGRAELRWSIYRKSGITYSLSGCPAGGANATYFMASYGGGIYDYGEGTSFTTPNGYYDVSIVVKQDADLTGGKVFWPQLEFGSTATSFEPYESTDYTIDLNGTYYGGSVDLSAGTMTANIHKAVISSIRYPRSYTTQAVTSTYVTFELAALRSHKGSGNHAITSNILPGDAFDTRGSSASSVFLVRMPKDALDVSGAVDPSNPTEAEWNAAMNAFLAVTPIELVYYPRDSVVASLTPTQIYSLSQLDPYAPRLNTVYSDQVSVQVGYPKSPQATQNELTNAVVSLGGNL